MASNKYTYFAEQAKKQGLDRVEKLFLACAKNEQEHAKIWFKLLHNGIPDTQDNLKKAIEDENYECEEMYTSFAQTARQEGYEQIAFLFESVGKIEESHEAKFTAMQNAGFSELADAPTHEGVDGWVCSHCGYIHKGTTPPKNCCICDRSQEFFVQQTKANTQKER